MICFSSLSRTKPDRLFVLDVRARSVYNKLQGPRRARRLIAIAHPDFRDELRFEAKKRGVTL